MIGVIVCITLILVATAPHATLADTGPYCCALNEQLFAGSGLGLFWRRVRCPRLSIKLPAHFNTMAEPEFQFSDCRSSPEFCRVQPLSTPNDILGCLNVEDPNAPPPNINGTNDVARLKVVAAWRSNKPTTSNFTIVTQLTVDRLGHLWAQCRSWRGPVSAVVYIAGSPEEANMAPLMLRCAVRQIAAIFIRAERSMALCNLDLTLVYEQQELPIAFRRYPINALRNIARIQARTEAIILLDIDMLLSSSFISAMSEQMYPMVDKLRSKNVIVLAAFEVLNKDKSIAAEAAESLVTAEKAGLLGSVQMGETVPYDSRRFPLGHGATNFSHWTTATDFYEVKYQARYEPFLVVNRRDSPWHDARFRGYGQNKIVHVAHIASLGYHFLVHPTAYIVHRAHEMSPARVQFSRDMDKYVRSAREKMAQEYTQFVRVNEQFAVAKLSMDNGTFVPVLDISTKACLQRLSWWQ